MPEDTQPEEPNWQSYITSTMRKIAPTGLTLALLLLLLPLLLLLASLLLEGVAAKISYSGQATPIAKAALLSLVLVALLGLLAGLLLWEFWKRGSFREEFGVLWKTVNGRLLPYPFCPHCRRPIGMASRTHFAHCDPCQYWAPFRLKDLPTVWEALRVQDDPTAKLAPPKESKKQTEEEE